MDVKKVVLVRKTRGLGAYRVIHVSGARPMISTYDAIRMLKPGERPMPPKGGAVFICDYEGLPAQLRQQLVNG